MILVETENGNGRQICRADGYYLRMRNLLVLVVLRLYEYSGNPLGFPYIYNGRRPSWRTSRHILSQHGLQGQRRERQSPPPPIARVPYVGSSWAERNFRYAKEIQYTPHFADNL